MEINFLAPLPANVGIVTAVQAESPVNAHGSSPALPPALQLNGGTVVRGVVQQQRSAQGTVMLSTDQGMLSMKTDIPLKRGTELAIKIEQVKDNLIARIISIDGQSFAKYQESTMQNAAVVMDEIQPSSPLAQTVAPAAIIAKPPLIVPLAVPANTPYSNIINTLLPSLTVAEVPTDTTPSFTATTLRGVLLQAPLLPPDMLQALPSPLQAGMQQAQPGTALQVMVVNVALPPPGAGEDMLAGSLPATSAPLPAGNAPVATVPPTAPATQPHTAPIGTIPLSSSMPTLPAAPVSAPTATPMPVAGGVPQVPQTMQPAAASLPSATAAPLPSTPQHFTATVLHQSNSRELTVQTPFGMMKLFTATQLPKGSVITYEILQVEQVRGGTLPSAMESRSIPAKLEAMGDITNLQHVHAMPVPPHLNGHIVPRLGATLASDMLFLLNALQGGGGIRQWLGDALFNQLSNQRDEGATFMSSLAQDFASLRQLPSELRDGQWHHALIPLHTEGEVHPIQLFFKKQKGNAESRQPQLDHFLVEVELTRLGVVQFDGLVQKHMHHTQFDMMVRAAQPWNEIIEKEIARIFYDTQEATGMVGSVHFHYGQANLLSRPPVYDDAFLVDVADNSLIV